MKYFVTDRCIGCGLCEATCPAVFRLTDSGLAEALDVDTDDPEAQDAMMACPVQAIEQQ